MDEKFDIVKRFVEDNPNVPVETVAKETDTSMKQINRWIREERLSFHRIHHMVYHARTVAG